MGGGVLELLAHVEGLTRPRPWNGCVTGGCWMAPGRTQGQGRAVSRAGLQHDTGRSRKTALRAFQGRVKTPIGPKSGMFALIGPSRCGSGPSRSQRPQTIRRADGWPRRRLWRPGQPLPPSVRWVAAPGPSVGAIVAAFAPPGTGRLSGVQLIHVDADGLPALDKPGPDGLPKRSFGQMAGAVCVLGLQGHGGVNVAEGLADALALAARATLARRLHGRDGGIPQPRARPLAGWLRDRPHLGRPARARVRGRRNLGPHGSRRGQYHGLGRARRRRRRPRSCRCALRAAGRAHLRGPGRRPGARRSAGVGGARVASTITN